DVLDDDNLAQRIRIYEADARDLSQLLQDESVALVIYPKSLDYFELANLMNGGCNAQALVHAMLNEARRILVPGGTFVATGSPLDITHRYLQFSGFFDVSIDTYDEEGIYATKSADGAVLGVADQAMLTDVNVTEIIQAIHQKTRSEWEDMEQELYAINRLIQGGGLTPEDYDNLIEVLMREPGPLTGSHVPTVIDTLDTLNMLSVSSGTTYHQKLRIYDVLNVAGRNPHLRAVKSYSERIGAIRENVKVYFEDHLQEIVRGVGGETVDYEVLEFLADRYYRPLQDYWNHRAASGSGRWRPQEGPMYTARRERRRLLHAFQELIDSGRVTSEDLDYMIDFLLGYRGPLNDPIRENAIDALDILRGLGTSALTDIGQKREIHLALVQEASFAKTGHIRDQIAAVAQAIEGILDDSEQHPVDAAITVEENPGGIDFTSNHLKINLLRDDMGQPVPWQQQPIIHVPIDGMVPVILHIQPVTNLPLLMGARESSPEIPLTRPAPSRDELGLKEREDIFDGVKPAVL
ncbi:MAG: class I SAM-dependent methyltransferase, partial [Candidatus Omnitrophica bacterium]|nr:class I SAM-dependent methyltransferase [Candidatus Omnitrophota bacterium]